MYKEFLMPRSDRYKAKIANLQNTLATIDKEESRLKEKKFGDETPVMVSLRSRRQDVVTQITVLERHVTEAA
jgi:predicted nuclease with TOPRIM domain